MKLLGTVPLQEPIETAFKIELTERYKKIAKAIGWAKGDQIAVYRQGAGFFISKASGSIEDELKLIKSEKVENNAVETEGSQYQHSKSRNKSR